MDTVGYQTPHSATEQNKIAKEIKWGEKKSLKNLDEFASLLPLFPNPLDDILLFLKHNMVENP